MVGIQVVQPGQRRTRKTRTPSFPIRGAIDAFGLYPYFAMPVLAGETLKRHTMKGTVVSAPVASPIQGGWYETWLWYVRIVDLDEALADMFIGQLESSAGYTATADQPNFFTKSGQVEWLKMACDRIHDYAFLDEDETAQTITTDGVRRLKLIKSEFTESMIRQTADDTAAPPSEIGETPDQLQAYLAMRQMGMGITSYEDFLKTYGVRSVRLERGDPELLAYRRYWALPSNILDPTDGSPTGAFYWRVDEANEKDKMFKEPGIVVGLHAFRPKMYDARQVASNLGGMWGFQDFFPSYTLHDPAAGIREFDGGGESIFSGVGTPTADFWIDHRDYLSHGEQFVNDADARFPTVSSTGRNFADGQSTQAIRGEYCTDADITALWADAVTARGLDYDGIVQATIAGHIQDTT